MAANELLIDGWDADNAGFEITALQDWRNSAPREWPVERAPQRAAARIVGAGAEYSPRPLTIAGKLKAVDTATLVANLDDLKSMADSDDEVTIEFGDRSNKIYYGRWLDLAHTEITHTEGFLTSFSNPYMFVRLSFLCPDPFLYDSATSSLATITTATAVPLGSAPTIRDLVLTINGAATNPTITYKDSGGTTVFTLSITATLGASDTRVIDMEAGTIVDQASANAIGEWDSSTDFPWALDPKDGVFRTDTWPTLEIDAGDLDVTYRKAWL